MAVRSCSCQPCSRADALLAGDKGKALAQFQHHRVTDEFARGLFQGLKIGIRFGSKRLPVVAQQQAFAIQGADLAFQCAGTPVLRGGFVHVPLPGIGALDVIACGSGSSSIRDAVRHASGTRESEATSLALSDFRPPHRTLTGKTA